MNTKLATKNSKVYTMVAIYMLLASTLYLDCAKSDLTALNPYMSISIVINKNTIGKKSLFTIFLISNPNKNWRNKVQRRIVN